MLGADPDLTRRYYAITILGTESGVEWSCYSHWVAFTEDSPRREIREASIVIAKNLARTWRGLGESYVVVNSQNEMVIFLRLGGHALVERTVAQEVIPEFLAPRVVAQRSALGFTYVDSLPKSALNRAPTPTHRMRVLKRDDFRCRICGRRAADHVDVELHVHHIRPWGEGGVTIDSNLITLCHTCHKGLDPHFEWKLFDMASTTGKAFDFEGQPERYKQGVVRYRQRMFIFHKREKMSKGRKTHGRKNKKASA